MSGPCSAPELQKRLGSSSLTSRPKRETRRCSRGCIARAVAAGAPSAGPRSTVKAQARSSTVHALAIIRRRYCASRSAWWAEHLNLSICVSVHQYCAQLNALPGKARFATRISRSRAQRTSDRADAHHTVRTRGTGRSRISLCTLDCTGASAHCLFQCAAAVHQTSDIAHTAFKDT